jgi:hypothetical protein
VVTDNANNVLMTLGPNYVAAKTVLKDNSTQAGVWLTNVSVIGGSEGVSATLTFTRNGGVSQGAYLNVGQTLSSFCGYIINGSNYITKISISNSTVIASGKNAIFRLQRRTGLATFVDIPGTDITIPAGGYNATVSGILIPIGPNWEISAYRIGGDQGGGVNNVIMNVFTVSA